MDQPAIIAPGICSEYSLTIQIAVQSLAGERMTIQGKLKLDTDDLFQKIKEHWQIPLSCQKLNVDPSALERAQASLNHLGPLPMDLIVSVETVYSNLRSGSLNLKRKGIQDLQNLPKKYRVDLACLASSLQEGWWSNPAKNELIDVMIDRESKHAAANGLCQLLEHGVDPDAVAWAIDKVSEFSEQRNTYALDVLCRRTRDPSHQVQSAAIKAVQNTVPKGNQAAIEALLFLATPDNASVQLRCSAITALGHVSQFGDERVITSLRDGLDNNDDEHFTKAILGALGNVADMDSVIIDMNHIIERQHARGGRKFMEWVVQKMATLAPRGDPTITVELGRMLESGSSSMRRIAAKVLPTQVSKGDSYGIAELRARLDDEDKWVRRAALLGWAELVDSRDQDFINLVTRVSVNDRNHEVRSAATKILNNEQ